jgi:hypothetical protein
MAVALNICNERSLPVLPYAQEPQDEKQRLIQNFTGLSMELVAENSRRVKESLAKCQKETENTYAQCYSMIHDVLQKLEKGDEDLFAFEQINHTIEQAIHLTKERTRLAIDLTRDMEQEHDQILSKTTTAIETASSDVMQTAERPSADICSQQQLAFAAEIKEIESKNAQKELAQEKEIDKLNQEFEQAISRNPVPSRPSEAIHANMPQNPYLAKNPEPLPEPSSSTDTPSPPPKVIMPPLNPTPITQREEPETDLNSLLQLCQIL